MRKFYRSQIDKKIFGVCSGLARYTNTDVALWRIGFLVGIFTPLPVIIFYLITTIASDGIEYLD
jgi:phage shock protein PspC (stress-responsive transcriptional regulator)